MSITNSAPCGRAATADVVARSPAGLLARTGRLLRAPVFRTGLEKLGRGAPFLLLACAGWVLWREFHTLTLGQIWAEMIEWGVAPLLWALGLTAASFALLTLIEALALQWAGVDAPFRASALGACCANAFAHTLGFAMLTGTAVRVRLYAPFGASLATVAQITAFYGMTFGLGMASLAGLALTVEPSLISGIMHLSPSVARVGGILLLAAPGAYIAACWTLRGEINVFRHLVALPPPRIALAQVALGIADNAVTAAVVWVLLPHAQLAYRAFVGPYVMATLVGLVSHVPGGAGVFEGVLLALLPQVSSTSLAASFVGYRLIYYVAPLLLAAAILTRTGLADATPLGRLRRTWGRATPTLLSAAGFALGALLILTAIGRIDPDRVALLRASVPIALLETSHLLSLIAGLALMAAAPGLMRRRRRAFAVAAIAAGAGASTALLRGLDVGPAALATLFGLVLLASRRAFRRAGAWQGGWSGWWSLGLVMVILGAGALGAWIYADTPYEARLLAHVGYHADPSRFLRTLGLLGAALLTTGASAFARAGSARAASAAPAEVDAIRPLVEASPDTTARLALTGDKALLRDESDEAFVMFGAEGRSLVAMGDPVGDRDAGRRLLWRLKELADAAEARLVVYHATPDWLADYLDLGLSLLKLGEEAKVPLADFSLEGGRRRNLRQAHARALREGLSFELVAPPQTAVLMEELEAISQAWLLAHGGREKGFSLGRFEPAVLRRDPIALVRREGRIIAFANVWTGGGVEASIDLMRHLPDQASGVMDFLFVELMGWAKAQGFKHFNLGLAPLTGLAEHPLAPLWHKLGCALARRGGRFYGFEGLRAFKAKFDPVWTPRYLGAPPLALAGALLDVTRLVSRAPAAAVADLTQP